MPEAPTSRRTGRHHGSGWLIGVVVSIALTGGLSYFTNDSFQRLTNASQQLARTNQVLLEIERLTSQLRDAELQQRGYLVTGDDRFLEAYGRASSVVAQSMSKVESLGADDANQQARLRALKPLIASRLGLLEQMIASRQTRSAAAVDAEQLQRAGLLLAQIDSIAAEMTATESQLYQLRNAAAEHQAEVMAVVMIVGTFVSLGIVGTISALMSREVERRRRAEEVLQELNNALEQRVAARTTELRREVSERRRTEEILQSTSNFLDTVVESFPGMVFVKDARDRRFVLFNRAGEELLGCHRSNLIGKRDHDIFPKEEADSFVARDQRLLESGKTVVIPEERITTRERGVRLLRTTCVAVPGDQGRAREGIELDVSTPGRLGGSVQRHAGDSVKALLEFADSVSRGRSPSGLIVGSPA